MAQISTATAFRHRCKSPKYKTTYSAESYWANAREGRFRDDLGQDFHRCLH